ncbi:MAG: RNA-binding S4 domain-containing protein [Paracoccaceae bacterium]|jgi:ribosome-associated heat shock protein Hsp15
MIEPRQSIRLDKWLWQARFFKARSISAKVVNAGHVRLNGVKVKKSSTPIKVGDTLEFMQAETIRIVKLQALGIRRGPAVEAQTLYEDLTPVPEIPEAIPEIERKGRPTKRDRRAIDKIKRGGP